ncbi:WW domain-binding protein 4 [Phytophthora citrophthora]|uniref:WW domain-binding protein 4 n=1 Tax=Phytophthora citrophthora TaxID=4793 RepID=A0AAD9H238_9STRA|nr:WW domain-binding protein 4 [Phytophthora citrophthora]
MAAKHIDESTGSAYYYNSRTGESSWDAPKGFKSPKTQDNSTSKASKWQKFVDDETKATYYYDEVSGTSRWDKPDDYLSDQEGEETQEPESQTAEPQQEKTEAPKQEDKKEEPSNKENQQEEIEEGGPGTQKWVKYMDAATNKPYYYNPSTEKTQWEEPEGFDDSAAAVPAAPQISAEYQAHLNRVHSERLTRVTQQVLDPSGNLSKLNAILSGIDSSAPSTAANGGKEDAPRVLKAEWQQHIDAQTQRYYYHNVATGVTQWNKPDAAIVSGLADWIPPEVPESDSTGAGQKKTVSGVNYIAQAKFNRLTGKYEQLGGDDYWQNAGIASDRAGRQMSHFFDMSELEKNREEAVRRKEQLKRKNIDWKKISAEKKAKKQKQRNEWLYTD